MENRWFRSRPLARFALQPEAVSRFRELFPDVSIQGDLFQLWWPLFLRVPPPSPLPPPPPPPPPRPRPEAKDSEEIRFMKEIQTEVLWPTPEPLVEVVSNPQQAVRMRLYPEAFDAMTQWFPKPGPEILELWAEAYSSPILLREKHVDRVYGNGLWPYQRDDITEEVALRVMLQHIQPRQQHPEALQAGLDCLKGK